MVSVVGSQTTGGDWHDLRPSREALLEDAITVMPEANSGVVVLDVDGRVQSLMIAWRENHRATRGVRDRPFSRLLPAESRQGVPPFTAIHGVTSPPARDRHGAGTIEADYAVDLEFINRSCLSRARKTGRRVDREWDRDHKY